MNFILSDSKKNIENHKYIPALIYTSLVKIDSGFSKCAGIKYYPSSGDAFFYLDDNISEIKGPFLKKYLYSEILPERFYGILPTVYDNRKINNLPKDTIVISSDKSAVIIISERTRPNRCYVKYGETYIGVGTAFAYNNNWQRVISKQDFTLIMCLHSFRIKLPKCLLSHILSFQIL